MPDFSAEDMTEEQTREAMRQQTEGESALLSDDQRLRYGLHARHVAEGFGRYAKDDLSGAVIASTIASILLGLLRMPVGQLTRALDQSVTVYTLAAGSLAGVYELPEAENEAAEVNSQPAELYGEAAGANYGPYL